jgi:hypothetical protein
MPQEAIDMWNGVGNVARKTKPPTTAALHDLLERLEFSDVVEIQ